MTSPSHPVILNEHAVVASARMAGVDVIRAGSGHCSAPPVAVMYSYLVGNNDMHARLRCATMRGGGVPLLDRDDC